MCGRLTMRNQMPEINPPSLHESPFFSQQPFCGQEAYEDDQEPKRPPELAAQSLFGWDLDLGRRRVVDVFVEDLCQLIGR